MTMTIAQGLRRVSKIKGLIKDHTARANGASFWIENDIKDFDFFEENKKIEDLTEELITLGAAIDKANTNTDVTLEGKTFSLKYAVRKLQEVKGRIAFYTGLNLRAGREKVRESEWDDNLEKSIVRVNEVVYQSVMTEKQRVDTIDGFQAYFDELNNLVEHTNHITLLNL